MIALKQITNTGIFAFTVVIVFKLRRKDLYRGRKERRNC